MRTGEAHGVRFSNGEHAESGTLLRIVRSGSVLSAKVFRGEREITDECAASAFVWTKNGSPLASAVKQVSVSDEEINGDVLISCAYTETQGVYGTVSVDNSFVASHTPATADANHVFTLENGMLKVSIPDNAGNGTDYELTDGVLSVNPGFTGTITAEYEFTTNPTREIDFEYDHNGLRTRKKVVENGVTTTYDYTLHGKLITHLTKRVVDLDDVETTETLHFFYDAQSRPAFVEYEGEMYRYVHNLQGDIVAIVDSAGNPVVEYRYDTWGKPIYEVGSLLSTLGNMNLFRYRGYVYDFEASLYWLRDRYYQAESCRFVSIDRILGQMGKHTAHNLYSYCRDNPISFCDPDGNAEVYVNIYLNPKKFFDIGHVDISINGITYTYGRYDASATWGIAGSRGDGVLEVGDRQIFIDDQLEKGREVTSFQLDVSDEEAASMVAYFEDLIKNADPWIPSDPGRNTTDIQRYKFKSGNYKEYDLITRNCVTFTIEVLKATISLPSSMKNMFIPIKFRGCLSSNYRADSSERIVKAVYEIN